MPLMNHITDIVWIFRPLNALQNNASNSNLTNEWL